MKQVQLRIHGQVQGVYYRSSAQKKAQELGLKGWVRNETDGTVTAVAQGPEAALEEWIKWCQTGPKRAIVTQIDREDRTPENFTDFEIKNSN